MKVFEGKFDGKGLKVGIVAGRFNEFITSKLIGGALDVLKRNEVEEENIHIAWVPGAFEIPLATKKMIDTSKYDVLITLGAVIRGSTPHFDYVCAEVSKGVAQLSLQKDIPVIFGVLTTNSIEEAIERAGTKAGNKGSEAAFAAIEMVNLIKNIVVVDSTDIYGILSGYDTDSNSFIVNQLNSVADIPVGANVVTSDLAGATPANIHIGKVSAVKSSTNDFNRELFVEPTTDFSNLYSVLVVGN